MYALEFKNLLNLLVLIIYYVGSFFTKVWMIDWYGASGDLNFIIFSMCLIPMSKMRLNIIIVIA